MIKNRWWSFSLMGGGLLIALVACTSLFVPFETDPPDSQVVAPAGEGEGESRTLSIRDRVALRLVNDSPFYDEIAPLIRPGPEPNIVSHATGITTVVYSLELPQAAYLSDGPLVYPYVMFLVDSTSREILEVAKIVPDLSSRSLDAEILTTREHRILPMADSVYEELTQRADELGSRVKPKDDLCDPDATNPYQVYICYEWVEGHYDEAALDICVTACTVLFEYNAPLKLTCIGGCYYSCWIYGHCAPGQGELVTIYPCDGP